jgi:hypothetical protein
MCSKNILEMTFYPIAQGMAIGTILFFNPNTYILLVQNAQTLQNSSFNPSKIKTV